jgi:hypothetical protein
MPTTVLAYVIAAVGLLMLRRRLYELFSPCVVRLTRSASIDQVAEQAAHTRRTQGVGSCRRDSQWEWSFAEARDQHSQLEILSPL